MRKVIFGIIGCGDVTEKKSGPAFRKLPHTELKWVMRRDEGKLRDYAARHGVEHYSTDYRDLLDDPEVDAVYIATPPHMHSFYTLEAARAKKDVYVEKPMAVSVAQCREMIEACRRERVRLFVAYYRREQEKFRKIKEIIESGQLGEIRSFSYIYANPIPEVNPNRAWLYDGKISGGGQLYDVGSHMIDIMLYLFGEVAEATGISRNQAGAFQVEDVTSGFLSFRSGVQGAVQLTFNGAIHLDRMTLMGSEGSLEFSIMSNEPLSILRGETVEKVVFQELEHVQMPMISKVAQVILGEETMEQEGQYGLRTQEILETFRDSGTIRYES